MSGFVTDKRVLDNAEYIQLVRNSTDGRPSGDYWTRTVTQLLRPALQETTSYRSRGGGEDSELAADLEIFRNGFKTNDPRYDRGHEFYTTRDSIRLSHPYWECWSDDRRFPSGYRGPLIPDTGNYRNFPAVSRMTQGELASYGTRAINATAPTAPHANVATSVSELMLDGLPSIIGADTLKRGALNARQAGSEYLNVQFGWLPMLSDLRSTINSLKRATSTVRQLRRDSGKVVRRRFSFPSSVSTTESVLGGSGSGLKQVPEELISTRDWTATRKITLFQNVETRLWFSGAYTYYLAGDDSVWGKLQEFEQRANVLLGTRVTPETLWELAPWSWLIDWKTNIGSAIGSAERVASDSLVLRYGYLMRQTVARDTYVMRDLQFVSRGPGTVTMQLGRETKERYRATPYGFGLATSQFTDRQWAILAALGMTKAPKALR